MKIRNVLVPVDFSSTSRFAVDYGVTIARLFRARLTLLHVVEFPTLSYIFPPEGDRASRQQYDQSLRLLSALLGPEDQDDLDLQIRIRRGDIADEIRSAIRDEDSDLVVMGTHGRGFVRRLVIGSVTHELLRKLSVPILTVSRDSRPMKFSRILFATDLTGDYRDGFHAAVSIAQKTEAELVILHSIEPIPLVNGDAMPEFNIEADMNARSEEARPKLVELEAEGILQKVRVRMELAHGPAAETILANAKALGPDLIVLGVRDKGLMERLFFGSTAELVVRESCVPVLSIPAHAGQNSNDQRDASSRSTAAGGAS